jgi:hypothetical protein
MKQIRVVLFFIVGCVAAARCSIPKEQKGNDFIWENYFLLDSLKETLDPRADAFRILELNHVPDSLVDIWIKPLRGPGAWGNLMISYQFGTNDVHAIVMASWMMFT